MADATPENSTSAAPSKNRRQGRSPAFPFISLGKALERAEVFRVAEGGRPTHFAPLTSVFAAWKLGAKTGRAKQTLAALGHYSLLEFQGSGDSRSTRLTDLALRILLDVRPNSSERNTAVRKAALAPPIHAELWEKWGRDLPSDPTFQTYLVLERRFSKSGAEALIAEYKETISYSNLLQPSIIPADNDGESGGNAHKQIEVGDSIQVEVDGAAQFEEPKRVRAVKEHEGRQWVFVEGSETGILMDQAELVEKGGESITVRSKDQTLMPPILSVSEPPTLKEEREWARGSLSRDTTYRLIIAGDLGPKEIGKLIKLLEAQKSVLSDEY